MTGLLEDEVGVGDILRIGRAVVQATLPRLPCFKFAHKIGRPAILKEFLHSGRSGFYHRVLTRARWGAGDASSCWSATLLASAFALCSACSGLARRRHWGRTALLALHRSRRVSRRELTAPRRPESRLIPGCCSGV